MDYLSSRKERSIEKDNQEKEFLIRTKKYGVKELNMSINEKKVLIDKLRKILSKKYKLKDLDYIILIDKFKLDDKTITKNTIEQLIGYLNMELKYNAEDSLEQNMEIMINQKETFDKKLNENGVPLPSPNITPNITPNIVPSSTSTHIIPAIKSTYKLSDPQTTIILDLLHEFDLRNFEGVYEIPIKFTNNTIPTEIRIKNIILSSNIISKYKLDTYPYILIKIREFNNNIFINNSQKYYFTYFNIGDTNSKMFEMLNKNVFIPNKIFSLLVLHISFYDHEETLLKIIDFDETNDFLKIFLDIKF